MDKHGSTETFQIALEGKGGSGCRELVERYRPYLTFGRCAISHSQVSHFPRGLILCPRFRGQPSISGFKRFEWPNQVEKKLETPGGERGPG